MYRICNSEAVGGANNDAYGYVETDPSGRYGRFKEVLGKGAMKTVYKAFDEMLGLEVAWNQVKLIGEVFKSPDELHRLYSEVHLLKNLCHDSIIRFFTSWVDADSRTFNFVTEMFTSGTLREYRQRYKRVHIRVVKNWARQILHGLAYLHSHDPPVIHRDLKCNNIFVNGHLGQVKIGDLGLAAILRGSHNAHSVIGTPEFMAPEVYEEEYNELVDIYSFGMCVLEMLTSEYPYSECTNPAQIYKKVTSGKLPNAFYKIQDVEAKKFVGKCLESAAKRLTANEILLDPFLALHDDGQNLSIPNDNIPAPVKPNSSDREKIIDDKTIPQPRSSPTAPLRSSAMTITGTMNPYESDAVFLKVQICNNSNGQARNIYFPFDVMNDTAANVAAEMVNELEIKDWEPSEIAVMIEDEISSLLPSWNHRDDDSFSYDEEDYDGYDLETHHHPQCRMSSHSPFSSQTSLPALCTSIRPAANNASSSQDWFQNTLFANDDVSSPESLSSHKYSNLNYDSADFNFDANFDLSSRRRVDPPFTTTSNIHSTRFCPAGSLSARNCYKQGGGRSGSHKQPNLCRMRSLLDVRSQLLHRSLVEEIHKRRLFKTVGAVENIGFQEPKGEFPGSPAG